MKAPWHGTMLAGAALTLALGARQAPSIRITSPPADAVLLGVTRLEAVVEPQDAVPAVQTVTFTVDGQLVCTVEAPPFACQWDAGEVVRNRHVRVVAAMADGGRIKANRLSANLEYAERVRTDAVLVPVIVTRDGQFVRGLQRQDFEITEDGVRQPIAAMASEDGPLDLVIALDVSGSMEASLDQVKAAVKRLLSKLRPGDAVTLVGFNDNLFVAAERETDPQARERAVDLLMAWGGTALYDATVRAIDLVSRDWGRKGIIIFSDGDDRNSLTTREAAGRRVQESDAMLYTVGFGRGATVQELQRSLEVYATASGGRAFFPRSASDLDGVFDEIVTELAHQYVLSYALTNVEQGERWRSISVQVRGGHCDVRARQGYRVRGPQRGGR
jgi:Ca-activated chloride channel family protein